LPTQPPPCVHELEATVSRRDVQQPTWVGGDGAAEVADPVRPNSQHDWFRGQGGCLRGAQGDQQQQSPAGFEPAIWFACATMGTVDHRPGGLHEILTAAD
jgi:hypothetical protein